VDNTIAAEKLQRSLDERKRRTDERELTRESAAAGITPVGDVISGSKVQGGALQFTLTSAVLQ